MKYVVFFVFFVFLLSCSDSSSNATSDARPAGASDSGDNTSQVYEFTAIIKGGPLDGKTMHGIKKKGNIQATVNGGYKDGFSVVEFRNFNLEPTGEIMGLRVAWEENLTIGKKTPHYNNDGTKKYGDTGSFLIINESGDFDFSRMKINFKEADIQVSSIGTWRETILGEVADMKGSISVTETVTDLYDKENKKSNRTDITLEIEYHGMVTRRE